MVKDISLRISRPFDVYMLKDVAAVVLPATKGNITILPERAPSQFLIENGIIQILDKQNQVIERCFVSAGVADIASNVCEVAVEKIVPWADLNVEKAMKEHENAQSLSDKRFYQMVLDNFNFFKTK